MVVMDKKARTGARIIVRDDCYAKRSGEEQARALKAIYRECDIILRNAAIRMLAAGETPPDDG